ncbi:GNAT family N-acetyltransferase [Nitriliruptor alkaliphilus]|uniref:GNAT family N-acetyltransferase n=1 Tax=Nitriliruptor alkaliphilus TaxID=427918 RepID=UPI0006981EB0|nr:GNAT family protein [Nitriliruptor alkaliphilus]
MTDVTSPDDLAHGLAFETERLLLRPYEVTDLPAMADMHGRADVARYLMWDVRDDDASRAALERHLRTRFEEEGDTLCLAAFERDTGDYVGEFLLILTSREHRGGEVGYILHPDRHGRGYATEGARAMVGLGFERFGLHRIIGRLDGRNVASARVLEKVGMRREAYFVRNELVKGEWTDEAVYAVLADEWSPGVATS